ncbi:MAG: hypothetical protein PHV30_09025 [Candidatus Margulisbacteria bacterium]|nr:hypothetical protein [Candidatus Margulisiibacteriota bacterium]
MNENELGQIDGYISREDRKKTDKILELMKKYVPDHMLTRSELYRNLKADNTETSVQYRNLKIYIQGNDALLIQKYVKGKDTTVLFLRAEAEYVLRALRNGRKLLAGLVFVLRAKGYVYNNLNIENDESQKLPLIKDNGKYMLVWDKGMQVLRIGEIQDWPEEGNNYQTNFSPLMSKETFDFFDKLIIDISRDKKIPVKHLLSNNTVSYSLRV